MWIYVCVFSVSWVLARISEHASRRNDKLVGGVSLAAAGLVPALVAGLRDTGVGTDTGGYVLNVYTASISSEQSVSEIYTYFGGKYEIGYLLLAQAGHAIPYFQAFLFAIALVTQVAVLGALVALDRERYSFAYLIYLLMHFNESLNMSRQSIAMAFGLVVAAALITRRWGLAVVGITLAFLFHLSAILIVFYLPLYWVTARQKQDQPRRVAVAGLARGVAFLGIVGGTLLVVADFRVVAQAILDPLELTSRYGPYFQGDSISIPIALLIGNAIIVAVMFARRNASTGGQFVALTVFIGSLLYLLTGVSEYLWRISGYFSALAVLGATGLCSRPVLKARPEPLLLQVIRWIFLATVASLWVIQIVLWNGHETIPYTSTLLGIR